MRRHSGLQAQKEETDRLRSQTSGLIGAMDCFSEGIMLVNTKSAEWDILFVNDAWSRVSGAREAWRACVDEHEEPCPSSACLQRNKIRESVPFTAACSRRQLR
jgi:hypothetical protein